MSREFYTVLFDKTKGVAHRKVDNVSVGSGILAYWRMHWWFTEVCKIEMSSQRTTLAQPGICKRDDELAAAVENWERQLREFEERGGKPFEDQERITGLIGMLPKDSKIKEHLDITEDKLSKYNDWRREALR